MYEVILTNIGIQTTIHYSTSDIIAPHLSKMDLSEKVGQSKQFNFTIYSNNQGYDKIFDLTTLVKIIKDNEEIIFEGRVFQSPQSMSSSGEFSKEVNCESELSYFNDTLTRAWTITNMTVYNFIDKVINNHNNHTTLDKQIIIGNIEVSGNITCTTAYENSLNVLIDKMVNTLKVGYLVIRKVGTIRYLDYLPQLTGTSASINLGENMKDMIFSKDATNVATRIIPLGKDNLTIATVNGGVDYLESSTGILEFGIIEQIIEFKDIETASALKTVGQSKLADVGKSIFKLSANVLDLSTIGLNPDGFFIGTDTTITNSAINFNETFTIIQKDTDLLNPQDCKITLNDKFTTMTDRQLSLERVSQYVEKMLSANNQLNTFYLDGYINLLQNQMGAMADTAELQQTKAILFEDKQIDSPSYGAMALGTQGFMIASTILNGDWNWRTFGNGQGFTADLIVAGIINANLIRVGIIKSTDDKVSIDLDGGTGLIVKNGDNTVIIDGTHNMHKILVSGTVVIPMVVGQQSAIVDVIHNLGYCPCNSAYVQNADGFVHNLPSLSYITNDDRTIGIDRMVRCWADATKMQFYINRAPNTCPVDTYSIKYYIYKEVSF